MPRARCIYMYICIVIATHLENILHKTVFNVLFNPDLFNPLKLFRNCDKK